MRTIGILLVLLVWFFLGWKMCTDSSECCPDTSASTETTSSPIAGIESAACSNVICFEDNSCTVEIGTRFSSFRDSIESLVNDGSLLRITGIYNSDESYSGTAENLGVCRADAVRQLFQGLSDDQVIAGGQVTVGRKVSKDERITFSVVSRSSDPSDSSGGESTTGESSETASNVQPQAVIYFAFNSTSKLNNAEVESYLKTVAEEVRGTNRKIRLTGHTDDIGSDSGNMILGQQRANIVADYLLGQGVLRSQIISESRGESVPVASNNTEDGRAKNRRVELQII